MLYLAVGKLSAGLVCIKLYPLSHDTKHRDKIYFFLFFLSTEDDWCGIIHYI